ncbi:ATPase, T2SS/T4P/T4SS family, partial [Burkholderia sp. JPY481]
IGMSFARALRSILRQDPDIIMIGEIRDLETAQIAVQASLTGHLVLATLHTNSATSAVTRLTDRGGEPYLLASSLLGVLAQRLVRR